MRNNRRWIVGLMAAMMLAGCGGSGSKPAAESGNGESEIQETETTEPMEQKESQEQENAEEVTVRPGIISTFSSTAIAIKEDGTVYASYDLDPDFGAKVAEWTDIVWVTACKKYVLGVRSDGTVLMTDLPEDMDSTLAEHLSVVTTWTDIAQLSYGGGMIAGLKKDGTVVATAPVSEAADWGESAVNDWTDIVQVVCAGNATYGLKADGTCVVAGLDEPRSMNSSRTKRNHGLSLRNDQDEAEEWTDIVCIFANAKEVYGVKKDGTVCKTGSKKQPHYENVAWIDGNENYMILLKKDGTCYVTGANEGQEEACDWKNVVAIAGGDNHFLGVTADGDVLRAGEEFVTNGEMRAEIFGEAKNWTGLKTK